MASTAARRVIVFLATLAQAIVAIAMIVFVRRLSDIKVNPETQEFEDINCSLNAGMHSEPSGFAGDALKDQSLCVLAYGGASLTLLAMLALSIFLCLTCNLCGAGWIIEVIVQAVLCTGWVTYSLWVTKAVKTIDGWETVPSWDSDRLSNARSTVVALSWAEAVLTGLVAVLIFTLSCCGDRHESSRKASWV